MFYSVILWPPKASHIRSKASDVLELHKDELVRLVNQGEDLGHGHPVGWVGLQARDHGLPDPDAEKDEGLEPADRPAPGLEFGVVVVATGGPVPRKVAKRNGKDDNPEGPRVGGAVHHVLGFELRDPEVLRGPKSKTK